MKQSIIPMQACFILLSILSLTGIFSCKKSNATENDPVDVRLSWIENKMVQNHTLISGLVYDGDGKLIQVNDTSRILADNTNQVLNVPFLRVVEYNNAGNFLKAIFRVPINFSKDAVYDSVEYNSQQVITRNWRISQLESDTTIHFYAYDNTQHLIMDSVVDVKNRSLIKYTVFSYDGNNNLIEWNRYSNASGSLQNELTMIATYDGHPNPYRLPGIAFSSFTVHEQFQSTNNLLFQQYSDGRTVNYIYQYLANGLPGSVTIVGTPEYNRNIKEVTFKYE